MTDEVTLALLARDERIADLETVLESYRDLTRELDVLLNGEEGAAKQASLCDIVAQVRRAMPERKPMSLLDEIAAKSPKHLIIGDDESKGVELVRMFNGDWQKDIGSPLNACQHREHCRALESKVVPGGIVCKWHPMETAPNNQTILLYTDDEDIRLVTADDNDYQWQPYRGKERHVNNPVFWMPADPLIDVAVAMLATPDVPLINEGKTDVPQLPNADDSEGGHCD